MLSKQIERAQRKVEAHNFDARKNLLEYDDVANDQRKVIYQQRTELMGAEDVADAVAGIRHEVVNTIIDRFVPPKSPEEMWDVEGLNAGDRARLRRAHRQQELARSRREPGRGRPAPEDRRRGRSRLRGQGADVRRAGWCGRSRRRSCCSSWTRTGASTWPRWTTCARAFTCAATRRRIRSRNTSARRSSCSRRCSIASSTTRCRCCRGCSCARRPRSMRKKKSGSSAWRVRCSSSTPRPSRSPRRRPQQGPVAEPQQRAAEPVAQFVRETRKVGRNEPCPCGSGKKYKHCHGALAKEG